MEVDVKRHIDMIMQEVIKISMEHNYKNNQIKAHGRQGSFRLQPNEVIKNTMQT